NMARLALRENRLDEAASLAEESIAIFCALKAEIFWGQALLTQGDIQRAANDIQTAGRLYREALTILFKLRTQQTIADVLYRLRSLSFEHDDPVHAATFVGAADGIAARLDVRFPDLSRWIDRDSLRTSLSTTDYDQAAQAGAAMDFMALAEFAGAG